MGYLFTSVITGCQKKKKKNKKKNQLKHGKKTQLTQPFLK